MNFFCRFVPTSPVWHGAVQFNYTVMAGTVGQKVDASSSKRNPDDVIVSVILPSVATPNLTEVGGRIQIYEDEKGKFFKVITTSKRIRLLYWMNKTTTYLFLSISARGQNEAELHEFFRCKQHTI